MTVLSGVLSKLPFSPSRIVRVEGGIARVAGTLGGNRAELGVGFDVRTGRQVAESVAGDGPPRLGIEAPRIPGNPARLCLRDRATGKVTAGVDLPGTFRIMPVHFVLDGRHALVVNDQAELVVVEAETLRIVGRAPLPAPETLAKNAPPLVRAGGKAWLARVDTSRGATEIAPLDPQSLRTGIPLVFKGRAVAIAGSDSAILMICEREGAVVAEIAPLLAAHPRFELPLPEAGVFAAGGQLFAIAETGCVNLVQLGAGGFSWHRLPQPEGQDAVDLAVHEGGFLVVGGRALLSLEKPPFTPGGPHALDLSLRAAPPPGASAVPGVVVFAGPSLVAVDHPEYKRVNLRPVAGGAPYAKGQRVYFDQVETPPTGVVKAVAWHRDGEPAPTREEEAPPFLVSGERLAHFTAPPPRPRRGAPLPTTQSETTQSASATPGTAHSAGEKPATTGPETTALDRLARELNFTPAPLLRALVARWDDDDRFADLLRGISFDLHIRDASSATEFWPQADPCLSDLATDGDGNAFCFYDYPPLRGAPPPVVQWVHDDTPNVQWIGADFDSFLADWLSRCADHQRAVVAAVLEELGLPATWPRESKSPLPPWLAATFGPVDIPAIDSAENAGDLLRAERLLVGAIGQTYDAAAAAPLIERLARVHEALGWHRPLATLRNVRD